MIYRPIPLFPYSPIGIIAISFILTASGGSSSSDPVASPSSPK